METNQDLSQCRRDSPEARRDQQAGDAEFDAIVIGSGPGGATVAKELSKRGKRVLILERGGNAPLKDGLLATVSRLSGVGVGHKLAMARALTTGGTTSVYVAATVPPPLELFRSLGIDLSTMLEEAERELPLALLSDAYLSPQSLRLRDSSVALGHELVIRRMLVDQTQCSSGYSYSAKWTARSYVDEAVRNGATLLNEARALRVLVDQGRAIGVEYELRKTKKQAETRRAYGSKIILAAGCASTPILLRRSGIRNVANRGFYCHPSMAVFGTMSGLKAREGFGSTWGFVMDGGDIGVGDANFDRTLHRLFMLSQHQWIHAFRYSATAAMGVLVKDGLGGELRDDDRFHKELTKADLAKLAKGEEAARRVLEHAGARNLLTTAVTASHIGGTLTIGEHVDEKLETEYRDLHVCDGSLLPADVFTPTLTLICLGKYLAGHVSRSI